MTLIKHVFVVLSTILCMSQVYTLNHRRDLNLGKQDILDLFKNIGNGIEVVLPGEKMKSLQNGGSQNRKFDNMKRKFTKVKFVKRLIPQGQQSLKEEYDPDQNTLFKPLFVIHQRHDIPEKYNKNFMAYIADAMHKNNQESDDETLLQPFQYKQDEQQKTPKKKKGCCKKNKNCPFKSKSKKAVKPRRYKKQKSKTFYRDMWESFQKALAAVAMRTTFDKSGEEPETLQNKIEKLTTHSAEHSKKKKSFPYYPFWNWWIYKETIYHDECEEYQVKIGGICIKVPEH